MDEPQVRRWRQKKKSFLSETDAKRRKLQGGGRKPVLGAIEEELMKKIIHEREQQQVPCKLVQTWALEMASKAGLHEVSASRGWLVKYLRRTNFSLRRTTTSGQTIPRDFILKVSNFINYCAEQAQIFDLKPGMIINMDETPIWADCHLQQPLNLLVQK